MGSFMPVSILVGIVAILTTTSAEALCNRKVGGTCVTADLVKERAHPVKKKRTDQETKRSMMYAFPSQYGYPDFARENLNRPIDRQPLNPPSDLGGFPRKFPLH